MHVDLNLLSALDVLLDEGSVGGAAERLELSQPAMSRTLGRIRAVTGDPILVRTGRVMTPTAYAMAVHGHVHALVEQAGVLLRPHHPLDLAGLERTFTIQGQETLITFLAAPLVSAVREQAPGVTLRFLAEAGIDSGELRQGKVDLHLGASRTLPETSHLVLVTTELVLVSRADHLLHDAVVTAHRYAAADHVIISRRGRTADVVDEALAGLGLHRRVIAVVPSAESALRIVAESDAVTSMPSAATTSVMRTRGLRAVAIPLDLPRLEAICSWHQRSDTDAAHRWIRQLIQSIFHTQADDNL